MNILKVKGVFAVIMSFFILNGRPAASQVISKGSVIRIKVHGKSLEGNLAGDSSTRNVSIYLPASYASNPKRRYPVVYFLHGFTDTDAQWYGFRKHWINLPPILDSIFSAGNTNEMIFVTPDAYTKFSGSFYSNSITTGNWEDFIAKDLVSFIDKNYRTIPQAASRGLAGHSMGGYGTMRIGQKFPDIFSSIYLLSPATLLPGPPSENSFPSHADSITTFEALAKADFGTKAAFALAAAWSPNPQKPPFFLDLPYKNGSVQYDIFSKHTANKPLAVLDQNITNLKKLKAIGFDAGTKDVAIAQGIRVLDKELDRYGLKHSFEVYEGDHLNRIAERIRLKMVPFFSANLVSKK